MGEPGVVMRRGNLPHIQSGVLDQVADAVELGPTVRALEFKLSKDISSHIVIAVLRSSGLGLVMSLGSVSRHLFVVAVEREFDRVAGVLANLEDYDAGVEPLASGHVVPLENQWANEKGMVGVQLLPIKVSNALRGFPEFVLVGERRFHALLVVLLNAREMEIRRQSGLGALLDFFEEENRDLVAVS